MRILTRRQWDVKVRDRAVTREAAEKDSPDGGDAFSPSYEVSSAPWTSRSRQATDLPRLPRSKDGQLVAGANGSPTRPQFRERGESGSGRSSGAQACSQ